MKEQFATYKQSLALKELGFDESCFTFYSSKCELQIGLLDIQRGYLLEDLGKGILAPLKQQIFDWFRKEYQIYPEILTDCTTYPKFCFTYTRFLGNPNDLTEQEWGWENNIGEYSLLYKTYEEAESACVDKLIEIVKSR